MVKVMDLLVILGFVVAATWTPSAAGPIESAPEITNTVEQPLSFSTACSNGDGAIGLVNCAMYRTLRSIQQMSQQPKIDLLPGVTFSSDFPLSQRGAKALTDETLPANPEEKLQKLFAMIFETAAQLISGRTISFKVPENASENAVRAFEEGRGKMKKMMGPFMLAMGAKLITLVPIMLGGLALLVTKALIIAKIALVLALIVGMQYMIGGGIKLPLGGGGGGWNSYGGSGTGWTTNQVGGGSSGGWNSQQYPYARSLDVAEAKDRSITEQQANELAYAAQKQQ